MSKHAIILPFKENFYVDNAGAVSIWVNSYLKITQLKKNIYVFCTKHKGKLLKKRNTILIDQQNKFFTNYNYVNNISSYFLKKNITSIEVHNRPNYVKELIKHNIKINLVIHNDPNTLKGSKTRAEKKFLLENCNNIIFVSEYLKKIFLKDVGQKHFNNLHVIYNGIKKLNHFPKKKNIIVFAGKLNTSKGYDIFGKAILKILDKNPSWLVYVIGNEPREKYNFNHKRLFLKNWLPHRTILNIYKKASISVVNPKWQEPFGRTAMESASRGCAVITSKSGGLQETFMNNLILKKNNEFFLEKLIQKLIDNKHLLKKIQKNNFNNVIHDIKISVDKINKTIPINFNINILKKKYLKVFHISNFGEKLNHRLFNLSISKKLSNGLIRNGHDVINFDYRNFNNNIFGQKLDDKILDIFSNYQPDLLLLGHNNILNRSTLEIIKSKKSTKVALWYEDHLSYGDPSYRENLDLIEKNCDLIDKYFVTTHPDSINTKINCDKIFFLPIPVDNSIEDGDFYDYPKTKDVFFAVSHGVNYGKLKSKKFYDERENFIDYLVSNYSDKISFNLLGLYQSQPRWNYQYYSELKICKTALNLSRGKLSKYCTSNRIATLIGNGVPTIIDKKVRYQDFFTDDEMIFYNNKKDLINKLLSILGDKNKIRNIGYKGKSRYFKIFNNLIISDFLISKTFNCKKNFNFCWD